MVTLCRTVPARRGGDQGGNRRARGAAETEEVMTACGHLEPGLLLLLLPLACWKSPGMVGASQSVTLLLFTGKIWINRNTNFKSFKKSKRLKEQI